MKVMIEIRPGEGGEDARTLVREQAKLYIRMAERAGVAIDVVHEENGWLILALNAGPELTAIVGLEAGGHRWQRVPPNERRGRVHTSTVTVAVLSSPAEAGAGSRLRDSDIVVFTTKDSGPGGQHRNTTESCVVMRHIPTGIEAKAAAKSQHRNRETARRLLEARVHQLSAAGAAKSENGQRRTMVGSGMRGDKIRTYREQDDRVVDHRTNERASLSKLMRSGFDELARLSGVYSSSAPGSRS